MHVNYSKNIINDVQTKGNEGGGGGKYGLT